MSQPVSPKNSNSISFLTCPGCGCLCDDIQILSDATDPLQWQVDCDLANTYFQLDRTGDAACFIDGQPASIEQAQTAALTILKESRAPLFCGLGQATNETIRITADLADVCGAFFDCTHPQFRDPSSLATQTTGYVTASLGEIRHRADVVLFWGCNPKETHPRFFQRFIEASGKFLPEGSTRNICEINPTEIDLPNTVDLKLSCTQKDYLPITKWLHAKSHNKPHAQLQSGFSESIGNQLEQLYEQLTSANYLAIIIGEDFINQVAAQEAFELLADTVRMLNNENRAVISILKPGPNWTGASNLIASRTGYPGSVTFAAGYPEFDPVNFRAAEILKNNRCDALLCFDGASTKQLLEQHVTSSTTLKTILFSHENDPLIPQQGVMFQVTRPGVEAPGTMVRMDEVALPLKSAISSKFPAAESILKNLVKSMNAAETAN